MDETNAELRVAARAVARHALSDAFGHVSVRTSSSSALVTPPVPLGGLTVADVPMLLDLTVDVLPDAAPREAWMHVAILRERPDVGAVCRAQPPAVAAWAALRRPLPVLNGHAALLGGVATYTDSRLVRDLSAARNVARALGQASAMVLLGNGAVAVGPDIGSAVASMWVLERTADLALRAAAAGELHELPLDEQEWWADRASELLPRIYRYLAASGG